MNRAMVGGLLVLLASPPAWAATISVGDHDLFANRAGQSVEIYVSGGEAVQAMNFRVQVADGGPEVPGGTVDGPAITDLDIVNGTIFDGNHTTVVVEGESGGPYPQWEGRTVTTSSGTVSADGLLGTVTLDTTGFSRGESWDLIIIDTANGTSTELIGNEGLIPFSINPGTINLVPEPPVFVQLLGLAAAILPLWLRRLRGTTRAR